VERAEVAGRLRAAVFLVDRAAFLVVRRAPAAFREDADLLAFRFRAPAEVLLDRAATCFRPPAAARFRFAIRCSFRNARNPALNLDSYR